MLWMLERREEALHAWNRLLRLSPEDCMVHVHRYRLLLELGRDEEAAEAIGKLAELTPSSSDEHYVFGDGP